MTDGIVVSDDERLVLRPYALPYSRRMMLGAAAAVATIAASAVLAFALLFRAHVDLRVATVVALGAAVAWAYQVTTQVTLVVHGEGITVERRNRVLRMTRRRLVHRFADIDGVEVRSRTAKGKLYYDVVLRKGARDVVFWSTIFETSAEHIAGAIARFVSLPSTPPAPGRDGRSAPIFRRRA